MGKFLVTKRKNGEFQFVLKAGNGEIILASEGYTTKANCMNGIASVKKNSQDENRYVITENNGKCSFKLTATNGQTIGTSEQYNSMASCKNGIASVTKNAVDADIKEDLE